jgi:repressor LexA
MNHASLTPRQQALLDFIRSFLAKQGYAPSLQEMAEALKVSSLQGVKDHLKALERKGCLRLIPGRRRAIELIAEHLPPPNSVPIVGRVAAGTPLLAEENLEGRLALEPSLLGKGPHFALRVRGDSMVEAKILDGDYIIARRQDRAESGDIVVALIGDEATVKCLRRRGRQWLLEPANAAYAPIPLTEQAPPVRIQGKVVGLYRPLK